MNLFVLPEYFRTLLLTEWTCFQDLIAFDSSLSSLEDRKELEKIMSSKQFHRQLASKVGGFNMLKWFKCRSVAPSFLDLSFSIYEIIEKIDPICFKEVLLNVSMLSLENSPNHKLNTVQLRDIIDNCPQLNRIIIDKVESFNDDFVIGSMNKSILHGLTEFTYGGCLSFYESRFTSVGLNHMSQFCNKLMKLSFTADCIALNPTSINTLIEKNSNLTSLFTCSDVKVRKDTIKAILCRCPSIEHVTIKKLISDEMNDDDVLINLIRSSHALYFVDINHKSFRFDCRQKPCIIVVDRIRLNKNDWRGIITAGGLMRLTVMSKQISVLQLGGRWNVCPEENDNIVLMQLLEFSHHITHLKIQTNEKCLLKLLNGKNNLKCLTLLLPCLFRTATSVLQINLNIHILDFYPDYDSNDEAEVQQLMKYVQQRQQNAGNPLHVVVNNKDISLFRLYK